MEQSTETENKKDLILDNVQSKIQDLEKVRESRMIFFIGEAPISLKYAYLAHKLIRKIGPVDHIELVLESPGGNIESAAKIVNILRAYSEKYTVIVPYNAKSAASYIAVCANEFILCKAGEIGPIDPQVIHPADARFWIPAISIRNALRLTQSLTDDVVKLSMADKLDPYLIGAYEQVIQQTRQYLEENLKIKSNKQRAISGLMEKFVDHAYPITSATCSELGLDNCSQTPMDSEMENQIYDIFEDLISPIIDGIINQIFISSDAFYTMVSPNRIESSK